jgi:glycosyltransferase involved in cell wall biosynthesis
VQSGLDPEVLADLAARRKVVDAAGGALRILVASRMVFWKGVDLAIEAVARARSEGLEVRLELSESGPEEQRLRELVAKRGLDGVTSFLGRLPGHAEFLTKLGASDVVMHPAFSESFGQVCLEALACGVPVICLEWGGPGVIVDQETGYLVEPGTREQIVERLSEALLKCAQDRLQGKPDPSVLQQRASQFSWARIVASVDRSYRAAVEGVPTTRPVSP